MVVVPATAVSFGTPWRIQQDGECGSGKSNADLHAPLAMLLNSPKVLPLEFADFAFGCQALGGM